MMASVLSFLTVVFLAVVFLAVMFLAVVLTALKSAALMVVISPAGQISYRSPQMNPLIFVLVHSSAVCSTAQLMRQRVGVFH
jgi:hypothetical protein